jgi:hypothetical protein
MSGQSRSPSMQAADPRPNRRASPDVIEKRRAARHFNDILLGQGARAGRDGRTEKRRQRLLQELAERAARGGKQELKPIDVLSRVQALLDLGEPLASIRKACPPPRPVEVTPTIVDGLRRLHQAYGFAPEAYRFVGLDLAILKRAGVLSAPETKPLRPLARPRVRGPGASPARSDDAEREPRNPASPSGKRRGVA